MIHPIRLVNGQTKIRSKNSEGCTVMACGCAYETVQWLQICGQHWPEYVRLHEEAAREHELEARRTRQRAV